MKKYISTNIYTFEDLIRGNCLYVDKTDFIYRMISIPKGEFFVARPRRFGKSLMVSTLEAIFRGKKELFQGLRIAEEDYDWKVYPVIHLDFAGLVLKNLDLLTSSLQDVLTDIADSYGVSLERTDPALMFSRLISALKEKTGKAVVVLIDEYDKPILDHLDSREEAENFRSFMDSFYQVIKGAEPLLRFVFITGVTKFAKVSIFSKLNNLTDLTLRKEFATMFGYTQEELESYFADYIDDAVTAMVQDNSGEVLDRAALLNELQRWYDGFRFSDGAESVYNPVSVGTFFLNDYRFSNYWFETGTPTFLIGLMKRNHLLVQDMADVVLSENSFNTFDAAELSAELVNNERIEQMLYQTGYLTIDQMLRVGRNRLYKMRYPNLEVEDSFTNNLLTAYSGKVSTSSYISRVGVAASDGDPEEIVRILKDFFDNLPYDLQIHAEKYYQAMVYMMLKMCGMDIQTEVKTNTGRIDAVFDAGRYLYLVEFKLEKSAEAAVNQIIDDHYADKYLFSAREKRQQICLLGIDFCYAKEYRTIRGKEIRWLDSEKELM